MSSDNVLSLRRTHATGATPGLCAAVGPLARRLAPELAAASFALVYVWFGATKLVGVSPAVPLVTALQLETLPWIPPDLFVVGLGIFEVAVGVLFLSNRWLRVALVLMLGHMLATLLPLAVLPEITWQGPFAPTLEGQYIIKNFVFVALAVSMAGGFRLHDGERLDASREGTESRCSR